ncbi:MAG: RNase P subunit p30 family protein [Candidatus Thorarchaeota archaeon]
MAYIESRLPVNLENFEEVLRSIRFCEVLGINKVILEPKEYLAKIPLNFKKKVQKETDIRICYRINLRVNDYQEFKSKIRNFNNFSDILSIESLSKEVQLQSAKDSRVDIVSFSDPEILKTLTPGVISLTKQNNSFVEFSLAPIMIKDKTSQSKNFRSLYKFIHLALKLKANYLINGNFTDVFDYRHPRSLISISNSLLGIPLNLAKIGYRDNPKRLIDKIKIPHDKNLEQGVRIL